MTETDFNKYCLGPGLHITRRDTEDSNFYWLGEEKITTRELEKYIKYNTDFIIINVTIVDEGHARNYKGNVQ